MIGAVDIGGTKIAVGMFDRSGKILARRENPSGTELDAIRRPFAHLYDAAGDCRGSWWEPWKGLAWAAPARSIR